MSVNSTVDLGSSSSPPPQSGSGTSDSTVGAKDGWFTVSSGSVLISFGLPIWYSCRHTGHSHFFSYASLIIDSLPAAKHVGQCLKQYAGGAGPSFSGCWHHGQSPSGSVSFRCHAACCC